MKKHYKYPSIEQFRNVIKTVSHQSSFVRMEGDEAIHDRSLPKPVLEFTGTVKLHGTNAGVAYNPLHGMWAQSRNNILTPEKDNALFRQFMVEREDSFKSIFMDIFSTYGISKDHTVVLFGEWAGKGIQKGVAISELPRAFYIFEISIFDQHGNCYDRIPLSHFSLGMDYMGFIYTIDQFPVYKMKIDFNNPQLIQNELISITEKVEAECPVAFQRGVSGIGEGVVWESTYKNNVLRFKVKGEKHSVTKVKKLAEVDVAKMNTICDFVEYSVTENRVKQAISETGADDRKHTGSVLKWVANDIIKEESDTLQENDLEWKEVASEANTKARQIFFKLIEC